LLRSSKKLDYKGGNKFQEKGITAVVIHRISNWTGALKDLSSRETLFMERLVIAATSWCITNK
jgi:hypothetical protein